ncbi:MAG TPA: alcohol dehydrogenase catalytic domain-containing protein [Verrucomicrobiae bacterium]|nr:alcohol dehydrogenase catalytic domain-containing protein [Verrucomicrobiae bacterium]
MKAVVVHDFEDIRVEERPVPQIGPGEILVKTKVCGICSGDVMPWYIRKKAPLVLGHEPAGEVAAVGARVEGFKVGDRVFAHHHAPCFTCRECQRGSYSMCQTWKSTKLEPGGMAEYFRVAAENLSDTLVLPPEVDMAAGALIEPVACGVKAVRRAGIQPGDKVLVIGLGVMGQILVKLARLAGAGEVIGSDFVAVRRDKALNTGADRVVDPGKEDLVKAVSGENSRKADVVIVGPPSIEAIKQGLSCTGKGGTLLMFTPTPPGELLPIEPHELYFNEISVIPSYSCGPNDTREALELFKQGHLHAEDFITHQYTVEQAPEAFRSMAGGGEVIKAVVYF